MQYYFVMIKQNSAPSMLLYSLYLLKLELWTLDTSGMYCPNSSLTQTPTREDCQYLCELKPTSVGISYYRNDYATNIEDGSCRLCDDDKLTKNAYDENGINHFQYDFYRRPGKSS